MRLLCGKSSCIAIGFIVVSVLLLAAPQLARCQTETVLYSFSGQSGDGANPYAGLTMDKAGNLYGTTVSGGDLSCPNAGHGCGTVFKLVLPAATGLSPCCTRLGPSPATASSQAPEAWS